MFKRLLFLLSVIALLLPLGVRAQGMGDDDFGLWYELGVEKNLPKKFSLGLDGEVRTQNNTTSLDRMNLGINVGYKLNKYVKFDVAYVVLGYYNPEKCTDKYNTEGVYKGYNKDNSNWQLRHRMNLEATGSFKPCRWLRISLRERYQLTHSCQSVCDEDHYRYVTDSETGEKVLRLKETERDTSFASNDHTLRSRLKFEFDKKRCKWSPYVSVEFHDDLQNGFHLDKLRTCVGCGYKINKHHSVGLGYVLTHKFDVDEPTTRMHAVSMSYKYDF